MVVATKWLFDNQTKVKYPPKSSINPARLVASLANPKPNWVQSTVTFHHSYSEYIKNKILYLSSSAVSNTYFFSFNLTFLCVMRE